jgi:hypothetical protein
MLTSFASVIALRGLSLLRCFSFSFSFFLKNVLIFVESDVGEPNPFSFLGSIHSFYSDQEWEGSSPIPFRDSN